MRFVKWWIVAILSLLWLAGCSSAPQATALPPTVEATQPPATATSAPTQTATAVATATVAASPTPANTPTEAATATAVVEANTCLACHADKDQLIQTGKVEEVKPKESEGAG